MVHLKLHLLISANFRLLGNQHKTSTLISQLFTYTFLHTYFLNVQGSSTICNFVTFDGNITILKRVFRLASHILLPLENTVTIPTLALLLLQTGAQLLPPSAIFTSKSVQIIECRSIQTSRTKKRKHDKLNPDDGISLDLRGATNCVCNSVCPT